LIQQLRRGGEPGCGVGVDHLAGQEHLASQVPVLPSEPATGTTVAVLPNPAAPPVAGSEATGVQIASGVIVTRAVTTNLASAIGAS
jgi:hypothetical protein